MAFTTSTLTGDLADFIGTDYDPAKVSIVLEASDPILSDGATKVRVGNVRGTIAADGTFSFAGIPNTVSGAPVYRVVITWTDAGTRKPRQQPVGWFAMTANADLAAKVSETFTPTVITPTVAADIRAAAALGATNDTATASYVNNPASATSGALKATYVSVKEAPLSPYRYGLTDAMKDTVGQSAAVTTALQATLNAMPAKNGAMLIPRGAWYCEGLISQGRQFVIEGHGVHATSLKPINHPATAKPMIHILADTATNYGAGVIRGMTIGPTVATPNPGPGIKVEGAYSADVLIEDMWIGSMATGVHYLSAPNCAISRTVIEACQGSGIYAQTSKILTITDVQTFQNNSSGIDLQTCQGVLIVAGKQIENYGNGILANGGGGISVVGTLLDNNSKQAVYDPLAPGYATYDNIRFVGVNEGEIAATSHIASLGSAFARKGIDVDATSYRILITGGYVRSGAVAVATFDNRSGEGQTFTRESLASRAASVGFYGAPPVARPTAPTAQAAVAPAGGVGTAAGGWDTAANRDAAIATINNNRTRIAELEAKLRALGLIT